MVGNGPPLRDTLIGKWLHSHEEDTGNRLVFRPPTFAYPPSRGRTGFQLNADGTAVAQTIGAADSPGQRTGTWRLEGTDRLVFSIPVGPTGARSFTIVVAELGHLVLCTST